VGRIEITLDIKSLQRAKAMLRDIPAALPKALAGAVNDTTKTEISHMSSGVRDRINIKKKDLDPFLRRTFASASTPAAELTLDHTRRIPLKRFGARQTAAGVSYEIEKDKGRTMRLRAFGPRVEKLGFHVYRRAGAAGRLDMTKLVGRTPLIKLFGPSVWWVFVQAGLVEKTADESSEVLAKNVQRRVHLALLRKGAA